MTSENTHSRLRIVLFCGAGFSKAFGIPVMGEFTDKLRESRYLDPEQQADFDAIQITCDYLGALIGTSSRNLEQLASFLSLTRITRPDYSFDQCRKYKSPKQALDLIKSCIYPLVRPELTVNDVQNAGRIFDAAKSRSLTVVTTNYDVSVELAAWGYGHVQPSEIIRQNSRSKCDPGSKSLYTCEDSQDTIRLFKLHGSINWFGRAECFSAMDRMEEFQSSNYGRADHRLILPPSDQTSDWLFVPPSVLKPDLDPVLLEQWVGATKAIGSADILCFVGYSFPESDSFIRYFLASALSNNSSLRRLIIIDPDPRVGERAKSVFQLPRFGEVLHYFPVPWLDVNFHQLFSGRTEEAVSHEVLNRMNERLRREAILAGLHVMPPEQRIMSMRGRGRF